MNSKCYVSKVDVIIDNDNIEKLGVLRIKQTNNPNLASDAKVRINFQNSEVVHITGNLTTSPSETPSLRTETLPAGNNVFYLKNDNQVIEIDNKYCIQKITPNSGGDRFYLLIDIDSFKYSQELAYISGILEGDISSLSGKTNMVILSGSESPSLWGDLESISNLPVIEEIWISKTSISGTVESFVAGQINAGRTTLSTPIFCPGLLYQITFGGNSYGAYGDSMCLTWESADKIVVGKGNRSLARCTTIYTKGYTQEEAETEWPGKTIIRVDA